MAATWVKENHQQDPAFMNISVIIPTYNGAHKIIALLHCLEEQSCPPGEVIVVIDGSTDGTAELLVKEKLKLKKLNIVEQGNEGRASVRNRGAREAVGELLIFFDDDIRPEKGCIEAHIAHHVKIKNSIVTGAAIDREGDRDIQHYKAMLTRRWSRELEQKQGRPLGKNELFLMAANFSVPRETFLSVNGFNEMLTDAEDFDLAVRAHRNGIALYYDHRAFSWHEDPISGKSYIKRQRQYRAAHKKLFDQYPELYSGFKGQRPREPEGGKKFFFRFFCSRFWINWLDKGGLKKIIPKRMRYKMYDWIITANGVYFPEKVTL